MTNPSYVTPGESYERQMARAHTDIDRYYADFETSFPVPYVLWTGKHGNGSPRWYNALHPVINMLIVHINELAEQVKDLQGQIDEMNEDA